MFRSPTTIVVGAGASKDFGLPLGSELRRIIARLINIGYGRGGWELEEGDHRIVDALRIVAQQSGQNNINAFIPGARRMAEAMSIAMSVDNYLDAHQHDPNVLMCGKLAISRAILDAERSSTLYSSFEQGNKFVIENTGDSWLAKLTNVLTEGVNISNLPQIFDNLTIISFNYDRCIRVYLRQALSVYYSLHYNEVDDLLSGLRIFHPYGSVGRLPSTGDQGVEFGSDCYGASLLEISNGIKTFTERIDDNDLLEDMKECVQNSKNLIFLGFAFHRQNLKLIAPELPRASAHVFATTLGISPSDVEVIRDDLISHFAPEHGNQFFRGLEGTSGKLFDHYWRSITS